MMSRTRLSVITAALLSLLWLEVGSAATVTETFSGKAVNEKGEMEYTEIHAVTYEDGRVLRSRTVYFDSAERMIGELVSEYLPSPQFNTYTFKDMRARYEDGVKVEGDRLLLFRRKNPDAGLESSSLEKRDDQIVGQGFHQFLRLNLETISAGKTFQVQLVLPSRLNQYSFRIRKQNLEGQTLKIRLEIDNWFLRLFAPHVDCEYDLSTRRLLRYTGISNLEDGSGSHKKVDIVYTY